MQDENLNHLLKTFVKGSLIVFISMIFLKIATYIYKIIIARSFGQEVYGLFSLAIMVSGFVIALLSLGLQDGLLRYISFYRGKNETEKIQSILKFSLILILLTSFIGAGLLFFFSKTISLNIFHTSELTIFLKWFAIFIPISMFASIFHSVIRAYEKIGWYSFIGNILSPSIQLIFLALLIFIGLKTEAITLSYNLGFFVILLSSFLVCKYAIKGIFGKSSIEKKEKIKINQELLSYSWPIMFLGFVMAIFSWTGSFTIGYFKSVSDVGLYNAAVPIALLLEISPTLFLQLFLPLITKEYSKRNFKLIKTLSKQIEKWILILNLPIAILMFLFPGTIINILFGSSYLPAENTLRMLAIGVFFFSMSFISQSLLSMKGKSKTILLNLIFVSIINIILNIWLVPIYGIEGAGFSAMISYIVLGLLFFFTAKYHTSITPLRRKMLRIILISIIPSMILFYIKEKVIITSLSIVLLGIFFILSYFLLIFLTNCLDKNDLMVLKAIKKKITRI